MCSCKIEFEWLYATSLIMLVLDIGSDHVVGFALL